MSHIPAFITDDPANLPVIGAPAHGEAGRVTLNVVDLFAGPGGWDTGLRMSRPSAKVIGVEWDEAACATARAAGHYRLGPGEAGDVSKLDPSLFHEADYLHASPPCQGFSLAGKGAGREDGERLLKAIGFIGEYPEHVEEIMATFDAKANDHRSVLTLEPLRWVIHDRKHGQRQLPLPL